MTDIACMRSLHNVKYVPTVSPYCLRNQAGREGQTDSTKTDVARAAVSIILFCLWSLFVVLDRVVRT
jgi:hypothetical protein